MTPRLCVGDIVALDDYVGVITEYNTDDNDYLVIMADNGLVVIPAREDVDKIRVIARPIRYCASAVSFFLAQALATAESWADDANS